MKYLRPHIAPLHTLRHLLRVALLTGLLISSLTANSQTDPRPSEALNLVDIPGLPAQLQINGVTVVDSTGTIPIADINTILEPYAGRTITRDFNAVQGQTFSTFSELLFPAEPLTASLTATFRGSTGGSNFIVAKSTAGTDTLIAHYTVTRQATSDTITTIAIESVNQPFTQSAQGTSATGSTTLTNAKNTNYTLNLTATNATGTATDALSILYRNHNYYGLTATNTPSDANLQALTAPLRTNRSETFSVSPSPEGYVVLAYPASYGQLSSLTVNGFASLGGFTLTTRSVTNATGYAESYHIYVSNNLFTSNSNIVAQ